MEPIRAVFADDDPGMRLVVRKLLEHSGDFAILGEAEDGQSLLRLVEAHSPQVVLLDVEMPGMNGVEAARVIQDTDPAALLIFITAHHQYMADAFAVYAFDYLLKPFKTERALQTLEKAKQMARLRLAAEPAAPLPPRAVPAEAPRAVPSRLMLRHREGVHFVDMDSILLVQRESRATVLYTLGEGRYVTGDSLGQIESRLDKRLFFRCHKSYIINLTHIESVSPYGRWTYIVKLHGTRHDALITHERYAALEKLFG